MSVINIQKNRHHTSVYIYHLYSACNSSCNHIRLHNNVIIITMLLL
ncbi:hypothetical protein BACPEC_01495 [[Bacteroides] pectinophilus ATCC 43243]|uniref:Uncharacterized protein n=1 Tax=[Bacteroides] pectinophilus ATCC 43243 TaxID=483218 RepID=B7ATM3_9FIRM|nr:hypothetical protein BACPEC_01495 [[Bacteroides] pectinophilus ATCC 43243]